MNEAGALRAHTRGPAPASSFVSERYSQAFSKCEHKLSQLATP